MSASFRIFIFICSLLSVFIPLSFAIIQWRKLPADISLIRWVLINAAVFELTLFVMGVLLGMNNWLVGDVSMFIQFALLLYILGNPFARSKIKNIVYIALVVLYGISLMLLKSHETLNAFSGLVLIIASILFFYKLLNELKVVDIQRQPMLWIAFAILFYYSGNLFVFLAKSYLLKSGDLGIAWDVHNVLNTIKNILFAVALWQNYRTMKSSV